MESIDIEVLTLMIGFDKATALSGITEENIREMIAELQPEKHPFFAFFRDSLKAFIRRAGVNEVSRKLKISPEVLNIINGNY